MIVSLFPVNAIWVNSYLQSAFYGAPMFEFDFELFADILNQLKR